MLPELPIRRIRRRVTSIGCYDYMYNIARYIAIVNESMEQPSKYMVKLCNSRCGDPANGLIVCSDIVLLQSKARQ